MGGYITRTIAQLPEAERALYAHRLSELRLTSVYGDLGGSPDGAGFRDLGSGDLVDSTTKLQEADALLTEVKNRLPSYGTNAEPAPGDGHD